MFKSSPFLKCAPVMNDVQLRNRSKIEHWEDEAFKDGHGIQLYSPVDGKRGTLRAVEMRFKRLDWGAWIRVKAGRHKKHWRATTDMLQQKEKHVFCAPYHKRRFDRCVSSEFKEQRHIPDDPYRVYNNMSYQWYRSLKTKNMERIKKYGRQIYTFPVYKAHTKKNYTYYDKEIPPAREPPGYHADIAAGEGIYYTDPDKPQNIMAPNYTLERRHHSKQARAAERKYFKAIARCEPYYGRVGLCSSLRLPVAGTKLG